MAASLLLAGAFLCLLVVGARCERYSIGDVRNCPVTQPTHDNDTRLLRMEVLPGIGFDNLRNLDMSQVVVYNYSRCRITSDGQYLIPDELLVVPTRESNVQTYAQLIEHWSDYKSMTAFSVNAEATVYSMIGGKFSTEFQHVKAHQVMNKGKTTRVQIRHNLYRVSLQPDSQLHPRFKNRLLDIAANLQNNNTLYAEYLSEMLIRQYGTHVVTGVDAGAILAQLDTVKTKSTTDTDNSSFSMTASASANFFDKFSFSVGSDFSIGSVNKEQYLRNRHSSQILSIGGPPFQPNMTIKQWQEGVPNGLVAIDRQGDPLYYVITSQTLPELPGPTLRQLMDIVYSGVVRYYQVNTHYGCTDEKSPNFNYLANIDDNSCKAAVDANFTFGGMYQTCQQVDKNNNTEDLCALGAAQPNPLTGNMSCPRGYQAIPLHHGTTTRVSQKKICKNVCSKCGWWKRCCKCMSATVNVLSAANYQAYWCAASGDGNTAKGYLFGGLYTSKSINPVTKSMSCPGRFFALNIAGDIAVCVSDEYQLSQGYAISFGGFFSCQSGNWLSSNKAKDCPQGYSRVLATIEQGCAINYCAKFKSDTSTKPPRLPPFRNKPNLKLNISQSLVILGPYGRMWLRDEDGNWVKHDQSSMTGDELLDYLNGNGEAPHPSGGSAGNLSPGASSAISIVATLLLCSIIAAIVLVVTLNVARKKRKKREAAQLGAYLEIPEEDIKQRRGDADDEHKA